jgi:SRSO17 transposase
VARQYTGTSGKIDNCQLGVFLAYGSARGRALVDRELYLPTSWTEDADRCAAAGIPAETGFATKPQLGVDMLARAHAAGVLAGWVTADEAFGQNRAFRSWLAAHEVPFVLATRSDDTLTCPDRRRHQAKRLAALAGDRAWERRSAGPGAHGERLYDWTVLALDATAKPDGLPTGWGHWLLVRRQIDPQPGKDPELAFYRCAGPAATPAPELIRVAGARWAIEECFQTAKNEAGLDHYQVRGYRAWYAHITLAMLAAAYLAATRAQEAKKGDPRPVATG